jgi:N utilization substance protein B
MAKKSRSPRRKGRERAFQILYGCSFSPVSERSYVRKTFENFLADDATGNTESSDFAWDLISGVLDNKEALDLVIANYSRNWRLERIARIELTILRLALYEMFYRFDVPVKVAINEAIELSKRFGDSKSGGFVNGILDAIARRMDEGRDISPFMDREGPIGA